MECNFIWNRPNYIITASIYTPYLVSHPKSKVASHFFYEVIFINIIRSVLF